MRPPRGQASRPSIVQLAFFVGFAAALLLGAMPAFAAPDLSHLSSDPEVARARALFEVGHPGAALSILRALPPDHRPDRIDILFLTGLAAIGESHRPGHSEATRTALLDEAVQAFRAILVHRPELVRVRLELARAFFLQGEDTLARRHFEQVLAGKLPPVMAANIGRFLRIIRARQRWHARFGVAVAPDSNLNTASGTRTIWLDTPFGRRLPFTRRGNIAPKSGLGVSIWGGGEYLHPLGPRLWIRSRADANIRDYKGGDFDRQFFAAHLGPRWLFGQNTEASLLATVQRQWTTGTPETDQYGLRMEAEHRLTPRLSVEIRAGLRRRNCRDCNHLDGPVGEVSLGASWAALPTLRLGGDAGWNWSRANDEAWRSTGPETSLGATLALPAGFTLGARGAMQWTGYRGRGGGGPHFTLDRKPRQDRTRTLSISVHNRAFTVFGFSPRLSLINERHRTNAQTLGYKRNRGELSFVRQF